MSELQQVTLVGRYRGDKAKAVFKRRGKTWELTATVGKRSRLSVIDYREKPCWTVACDYMAELVPSKPKQSRKREPAKPELKLYA